MGGLTLLALVSSLLALQVINNGGVMGFDYGDAASKTLMFFEAQRSGKLPSDQRVKWRGDSGLRDGFLQGVDLVGGYYDAGDHVKFGLPMAFSVTMLSWGAIDFRKEVMDINQLGHTLRAIKWGTDYFIKAHKQPNVLWGQVGDGSSDHYCWERAEDMTTPRTAFKLDPEHPGSDLAAETAAAMASASIAFRLYNSTYSYLLLAHAKQDELLWAAAWLFRATGDEYYLKYVVDNAASMGGTGWAVGEFSWDNKYAGLQILLAKVLLEGKGGAYASTLKQYKAKADFFACACMQKNDGYNVALTPGGLLYVHEWNNLQYASSAAFLLAVYSDYLSAANAVLSCADAQLGPQYLLKFAQSQADYILGKNPQSMSYIVGYGAKYPVHVHHRDASIASTYVLHTQVGCVEGFEKWYRRAEADPNVIVGALVGGPNRNDEFSDDRSNYEETEPTISAAAPLLGLFSKLQSAVGGSGPSDAKKSPTTEYHPAASGVPVEFLHSITDTWTVAKTKYYRHKVIIKNTSKKPITQLKLRLENLSGSLWGLTPTSEKNMYELPKWLKVLKPASQYSFVYVQGGPQAKVSVISYK
ncbi:hypothetical protein Scep_015964 [Stephania cephalantha]|uniref:Endoglucanase n=1 Tax=Stephania cephalantha TaxID=152367 RepID=A0AAP0INF3_9MAGN